VSVAELGCDFYTVSAQKWLLGPAATGCLHVRRDRVGELRVTYPSYLGWQLPEYVLVESAQRYEGGWTPAASVAGLLAALAFAEEAGEERFGRAREATERCRSLLAKRGVEVVTEPDQGTLVSFRAEDPPALVDRLAERGVVVREVPGTGMVRASCGFWTSEEDLARLADGVAPA
jgi:L-cysteine/cystine lyase